MSPCSFASSRLNPHDLFSKLHLWNMLKDKECFQNWDQSTLSPMTSVRIRHKYRQTNTHTHTHTEERWPYEDKQKQRVKWCSYKPRNAETCQQPPEARKRLERILPQPLERVQPCWHLDFAFLASRIWCKRINLCFKSCNLWCFVMTALGNEYVASNGRRQRVCR